MTGRNNTAPEGATDSGQTGPEAPAVADAKEVRTDVGGTLDTPAHAQIRELSDTQKEELLLALKARFAETPGHYKRPDGISFAEVEKAFGANPDAMHTIYQMEKTGGAPDIISVTPEVFVFAHCSKEAPEAHRNTVYDREALIFFEQNPSEAKPKGNAIDISEQFGAKLIPEDLYRLMQETGKFDRETKIWVKTPAEIRQTGCAFLGTRDISGVRILSNLPAHYFNERIGLRAIIRVSRKRA